MAIYCWLNQSSVTVRIVGLNISTHGAYNDCSTLVLDAALRSDKEIIAQDFGVNV